MNCALSISKDSPILHRPKIPKNFIFLCGGISRVRNVSTTRGEGSSHNASYMFSGIMLGVVIELHVALDHESKSIDSKQVEVYLFQYPMHELFVAAGDISGAFSMRNPTGAYNNNSCHKLRKQQFVIFFCSLFPLFKLSMFAWQFPLAIEFARLLQSEDMYSGTSWAVVGLSSVALTKTYVFWHLRCGFVIFVFWLWLCAGLYCHFIEARLVSWLRRMTEPQKKDPDSDYTKDYEDMKLYPGQK